jgi:hypothetical protein
MIRVSLSEDDQERVRDIAERVAALYQAGRVASMKYNARPAGISTVNLNGFGAELAVARFTGGSWNEGDRTKADIGLDLEVRQSRFEDAHLLLYDYDKPERGYVLAVGTFPSYALVGWTRAKAGMRPDWRHEKGSMASFRAFGNPIVADVSFWAVHQGYLRPMEEFLGRT